MFKWQRLFITIITGLLLSTSSASARFYSVDPVGFQESNSISFNRYGYANNNPYGFTDPNGEQPNPMKGGGSINAQIDLHATNAEMASKEMVQAKSLLDKNINTKYTFNAFHTQMSNFSGLKKAYGDRVVIGTHISEKDKWLGTVPGQIKDGYIQAEALGQKKAKTNIALHGTYTPTAEAAVLKHMVGPSSSFRLNSNNLDKNELLSGTFKGKDSTYYGHLNEMDRNKTKGDQNQNSNFDFIEDNLAE